MLQDHIINKCSVEFIAAPGVKKELIHNSIAGEKDNITNVIGEIFNEYFPESFWIEIDRIHLDLGVFTLSDFPTAYKARIRKLLIPEIEKLIKGEEFQEFIKTNRIRAAEDSFLLLENYLENGFSVVLQKDIFFSPDDFLLKLMEEDRNKFIAVIEKGMRQEKIRRRLKQLKPQTLQKFREIFPEALRKKLDKPGVRLENTDTLEIIIRYFQTGGFPGEATVLSPLDIEFLVTALNDRDKRQLASFFLKNLSNPSFVQILSEVLYFETVYSCIEMLEEQATTLKEWQLSQFLFLKGPHPIAGFPSHRQLFLKFLNLPLSAHDHKAELIYNYLTQQGHTTESIKELLNSLYAIKLSTTSESPIPFIESLEDKLMHAAEKTASSPPIKDTDHLIHFFQSGFIDGKKESISVLLREQLDKNPLAVVESIQKIWNEEGVRYRIAYSLGIELLKKVTEIVGSNHYTYDWWLDSIQKMIVLSKDKEELTRYVYFLYVEFLSKYHHQKWTRGQFEEWFVLNLKHQVAPQGKTENRLASLSDHEIPANDHSEGKENFSFSFLKIKALQYKINELSVLTKQGFIEEVQLHFEYYLEERQFLTEQFFKTAIPYSQWSGIWVSIPDRQLERVLAVVAHPHYRAIMELLEEFKLLLAVNDLSDFFASVRRKVFLAALKTLHDARNQIGHESLLLQLIQAILKEESFITIIISNFENKKQFLAPKLPRISSLLEKKQNGSQEHAKSRSLSFIEFRRVIKQKFPDISGFVLIYLSAVHQFSTGLAKFSGTIQEPLLLYVYDYLQKFSQNFSAVSFVRETNVRIAILYQIGLSEVEGGLLKISKDHIRRGTSAFYVLNEILTSLQKEDRRDNVEAEVQQVINSFEQQQIKEDFLKEQLLVQNDFVHRSIRDYLTKGILPGKEESGFESEQDFLNFIIEFERDHRTLFFQWVKGLLYKETDLESFLSRQHKEAENFIVQLFSGSRYEEFSEWKKEAESFIRWAYPQVAQETALLIIRKSLLFILLNHEKSTAGIFSYLQQIIKFAHQQDIDIITPDFKTIVRQYKKNRKGTSLLMSALWQAASVMPSEEEADDGKSRPRHDGKILSNIHKLDDQAIEEIFSLVQRNSREEVLLYFEYYLEEGDLFRNIIRPRSVPLQFWTYLSEVLSDSLLERLLVVVTTLQYAYFKELLEELKSLLLLEAGTSVSEHRFRKNYALLFHVIHEGGYTASQEKIEQEFLAALFSTEYRLKVTLESHAENDRNHISNTLPKLYSFIQKHGSADNALHDEIGSASVEEIKKRIQEYFPSAADFIVTFLHAADEYCSVFLPQTQNADTRLYRAVYIYLHKTQAGFSDHTFVKDILFQLSVTRSLYLKEAGNGLLKIAEKYIQKGNLQYSRLKEILLSQGYKLEESTDKQSDAFFSTLQAETEHLHSKTIFSLEEFKQTINRHFSGISDLIFLYTILLEEYFKDHPDYPSIVGNGELYKKTVEHLAHHKDNFSISALLVNFITRLASDYHLSKEEMGEKLLGIAEAKAGGDSGFSRLREMLFFEFKKTERSVTEEEENLTNQYSTQAGYEHPHRETIFSLEEFKQTIEKHFPGISDLIFIYTILLEEYLKGHSDHSSIVGKGELYKRIVEYLTHHKDKFSVSALLVNFITRLASDYHLSREEMGERLLGIAESKTEGDSGFYRLREILSFEFKKAGKWVIEEERNLTNRYSTHDFLRSLSFGEYRQILQEHFPQVAGFVFTYLQALEQSSLGRLLYQQDLFVNIYNYLSANRESINEFSSVAFVSKMNTYFSVRHSLDRKEIERSLEAFAEEKNNQGISRFVILKEILSSQKDESETFEPLPFLELTSEEYHKLARELEQSHWKVQFGFFRKILNNYINDEIFSDLKEEGFASASDINLFLKKFFAEHKGKIVPVIQELLSRGSALENLLRSTDTEIKDHILRELSGERYDEFIQWSLEMEKFLLWAYPEIDKMVFNTNVRTSLYRLLLNKDRITVGLFSYLEQVVENLKQHRIMVIRAGFSMLLEKYKNEGKGSDLFIKALERMEYLLSRKERDILLKKIISRKDHDKTKEIILEGRLLIHNAGIVLVGPFLYRYFERLGFLKDQKFKTEEVACRAVQLLQFLATGTTEMQEHELVLNKILCGVKLDDPIEGNFTITEEEKEISESLLGALLANWDKLKSNSIDALREGFLMRKGYLEQTESGWSLEVERKAMDILVDFIPWSFSLIKLSWMEHSLATKWKKSISEF